MNVEVVMKEKNMMEIRVDNKTVAEILRVYLNEQGVDFAAWRQDHPDKPVLFRIETGKGTPEKAIKDAVEAVKKDMASVSALLKKG